MKTDVAIIGGGAMGASAAYFLKSLSPGLSVTVIERDPAYELASTPRASGGVRRLFSLPVNIELSNYSIPFFEEFPEIMAVGDSPAQIGFKKEGYIFIVPPGGINVLKENYETQQRLGCNVIWLEPEEIKYRYPSMYVDDIGAAVLSPDDGWLDPYSLLMGFRKKAQSLGVEFLSEEVVGMKRNGAQVTSLKCRSGVTVDSEHYINAAGAWAGNICELLGFSAPITPMRRYEHYFECQEAIEPLPYLKDPERLAFRPEGNGYSGGVPTLDEPRGFNFEPDHDYFENVVWPALAHRFPQFEQTKCKATLPGLYDQNDFDGNAIIGPGADGLGNFYMLAGFSGHGLMHAPGCGRALAELILNGRYETIDLNRLGWQRLLDDAPLPERGII
ncbi:MAG: FAD-binding oxidoreductase [Pseudomonadota bacterium]